MKFEMLFTDAPEEWNGLTVWPVLMKDYPLFLAAKDSITAAQQSWPFPWCTVKYLEGLAGIGLLPQLAIMLQLVFRLDGDKLPLYPRMEGDRLVSLTVVQERKQTEITPRNFGELRELIARQNGLELPDETHNAELVQAQQDLEQKGAIPLKADLESLIYSVGGKARASPGEIMEWTVRRFQATERALDRSVGHLIASVTLAAGGKFKGGNPYPSWKFDREEHTTAVEPLSALSGRLSGSVEQK